MPSTYNAMCNKLMMKYQVHNILRCDINDVMNKADYNCIAITWTTLKFIFNFDALSSTAVGVSLGIAEEWLGRWVNCSFSKFQ